MAKLVINFLHSLMDEKKDAQIHDTPKTANKNHDIVIGAGLGRTGTSSLRAGLNAMGYKCYHMQEVMMRKDGDKTHQKLWIFLYKEKIKLKTEKNITSFKQWDLISLDIDKYGKYFETLLDNNDYNASVDWPSCMFYLELIEYYKRKCVNYKVLLSIRDSAEQWWKSYSGTIGKMPELFDTWFWRLMPGVGGTNELSKSVLVLPFGEDKRMNKQHVMDQYVAWIESVKQFVDNDKLLIYNVKQGWTPLTRFLELDIPDRYKDKPNEFIRTNESKHIKKTIEKIEKITMYVNIVAGLFVSSVVLYVGGRYGEIL